MKDLFWCVLAFQVLSSLSPLVQATSGPLGYLFCHTGVLLEILPTRSVVGTSESDSKYSVVEIIGSGTWREMYIYGIHSKLYLCVTRKGGFIGRKRKSEKCIFTVKELRENFISFSNQIGKQKLYFGLTKSGRARAGKLRSMRTKFLWLSVNYKDLASIKKNPEKWFNLWLNNAYYARNASL